MRKFNTSDIFTGYLKQLLKTFNLPKLKVYTKEHKDYYEKNLKERADILNTITEAINEEGKKYLPNDTHYEFPLLYTSICCAAWRAAVLFI